MSAQNQHLWSMQRVQTGAEQNARMILLGASNLKRALPVAVQVMRARFEGPLSFHVAMGHGRSYGQEAGCFGKKISGIFSSSIWNDLKVIERRATFAFVTDVGNDLAYGVGVETIVGWVARCVARLLELESRVVFSELPIAALMKVPAWRFQLLQRIFFPACRLSREELLRRAKSLNDRLREMAEELKMPIFSVPNGWYGLDPLHYRVLHQQAFWQAMTSLVAAHLPDLQEQSAARSLACEGLLPSYPLRWRSRFWTSSQGRRATLRDGTCVSFY